MSFCLYGCSLVVDPWGKVLVDMADRVDDFELFEVDLSKILKVRQNMCMDQYNVNF